MRDQVQPCVFKNRSDKLCQVMAYRVCRGGQGGRRGRTGANAGLEEEIRRLQARMESIETDR